MHKTNGKSARAGGSGGTRHEKGTNSRRDQYFSSILIPASNQEEFHFLFSLLPTSNQLIPNSYPEQHLTLLPLSKRQRQR
jgi:hypothetical protein